MDGNTYLITENDDGLRSRIIVDAVVWDTRLVRLDVSNRAETGSVAAAGEIGFQMHPRGRIAVYRFKYWVPKTSPMAL